MKVKFFKSFHDLYQGKQIIIFCPYDKAQHILKMYVDMIVPDYITQKTVNCIRLESGGEIKLIGTNICNLKGLSPDYILSDRYNEAIKIYQQLGTRVIYI